MAATLSAFNSQKFRFWSFVSMFLLVFVHGYNLHERYLQPWSIVNEPVTFNTFFQFFTANAIFRFRIPMLFIISGYLYALHDEKPCGKRTRKRLRTLLLPYIIWSAIGLLFTYVLETFPYGKDAVASSHLMQMDNHRLLLHQYQWYEVLIKLFLAPVPFQLWFIRVLFFYNLAYPWIKTWVISKRSWIFFAIAILLWLATFGALIFEGEGLLFFGLGVWMQKTNFDIDVPKRWLRPLPWAVIFIAMSVVKTILAFTGSNLMGTVLFPLLTIMHKLIVFSGLITAWYGCNKLVTVFMQQRWFVKLSAFSFMIYALHVPLITYAIDPVFSILNGTPHYRLITFIALPLLIILLSIALGWMLRTFVPKLYSVLTGERGL
jgi:fucose 4-O-acetylase-like acetyltransferase